MLVVASVTTGAGSQLSLAVGLAAAGIASHATLVFAGTPANTGAAILELYGLGSGMTITAFSRDAEKEADHIGLIYMARAGYPPAAAIGFWERFAQANKAAGSDTPWFLRTHPLDQVRIDQLKAWLPEAQAQLKAAP